MDIRAGTFAASRKKPLIQAWRNRSLNQQGSTRAKTRAPPAVNPRPKKKGLSVGMVSQRHRMPKPQRQALTQLRA